MAEQIRIISKNFEVPNAETIDVFIERGGYEGLKKALRLTVEEVVEVVKASGLRGRGGAGFPTGVKWSFMPKEPKKPHYLCCNADEGEPGTFKDRKIIETDPHSLIEGIIIGAYAIRSKLAFVYVRGEFGLGYRRLSAALEEARARGFVGQNLDGTGHDIDIILYRGAGAYICGEETALMESLEGKRGYPRPKPPFPAGYGVYGCPTTVNNVETLCTVPHIIKHGADWYRSMGTKASPGTTLFGVSGHVNRPGLYELPLGTPLREIIYEHAGGVPGGRKIKGVIPGGSSTPILTAEMLDTPMDHDGLRTVSSLFGTGAIIVMDETTDIVAVTRRIAEFYHHESCGQCTPCREGSGWIPQILRRIEAGQGRMEDLDLLLSICANMEGRTICPFGDAAAWPIRYNISRFRADFEERIRRGSGLPDPGPVPGVLGGRRADLIPVQVSA
ncbi:MAG: NADH-quinone oxidoreductase subunit NuoF [Candidatus Tectomicrobia bacterium]|nr:NADH-quinone oxidoreductase subunit NuoF [Candidatus Tectomicrobia bacterium]